MTIKTETRTVEIALKQWNEENACWSWKPALLPPISTPLATMLSSLPTPS